MATFCVLVVDDEESILKVMKSFFVRRGDQCQTANNGVEALQAVKIKNYDLVLTDISMPGMDGIELIRQIKALRPQTLCIIMSGLGTRGDILSALKIGVFDFIDKPMYDLAALTMIIDRAAESSQLLRERDSLLENLRVQNSKLEYSLLRLHEAFGQLQQQEEVLVSDLNKAQRMQRKFLPAGFPCTPGFNFFGYFAPCEQLGGDFFGTLTLADGRIAFYLVDVAGHGVSAAMITVTFRELMRARRHASSDDKLFGEPSQVLHYMNEALLEERFDPPIFVAMIYCVLDPRTGEISVSCAGHPAPILVSGLNEVQGVRTGGTVLGTPIAAPYSTAKCTLKLGDTLLFYSDGLPDARNSGEQEFSTAHLLEFMASQHNQPAGVIAEKLEKRVRKHLDGMQQNDDITFLVITRDTAKAEPKPLNTGQLIENSVKIVMTGRQAETQTGTRGRIRAGFTDGACFIRLEGLMSWQMAAAFKEMIQQAGQRASPPFHIDLSQCEGMDSTMLGQLLIDANAVVLHTPSTRVSSQLLEMGVFKTFIIDEHPCPQPEVSLDITPNQSQQACTDLILSAHEALSEASASNRQKFTDVVTSLRFAKPEA